MKIKFETLKYIWNLKARINVIRIENYVWLSKVHQMKTMKALVKNFTIEKLKVNILKTSENILKAILKAHACDS